MSRELRRVPVDFQHPIVWRERLKREVFGGTVRRWTYEFVQMDGAKLSEEQAEWDEGKRAWEAGDTPERWLRWGADDLRRAEERHARAATDPLIGATTDPAWYRERLGQLVWDSYEDHSGERPPFYRDDETGELVRSSAIWQPEDWPPPEDRGYVVYQTISEGSPITPCFETAEELVDWLVEKGTAYDDPMSREGAERFVHGSGWVPSAVGFGDGTFASGMAIAEHDPQPEPESSTG
jgi:hypothetical protein